MAQATQSAMSTTDVMKTTLEVVVVGRSHSDIVLPYKVSGKFNGKFSIVLLHGHGQNHHDWDDLDKSLFDFPEWPKAPQFREKLKGKLEFQQLLSRITTTVSYTRREAFRLVNMERKTSFPDIVPDDDFSRPTVMLHHMKNVLDDAKVPGPYLLVGFSSGGLLALEFQKRLGPKQCVGCVLLDPQHWEPEWPGVIGMKQEYQNLYKMTEAERSKFGSSDKVDDLDKILSYYTYKNWLSAFQLSIQVPTKCYINIFELTLESKQDFTGLFLCHAEMSRQLLSYPMVRLRVLFDELHAVHVLHDKEIYNEISDWDLGLKKV